MRQALLINIWQLSAICLLTYQVGMPQTNILLKEIQILMKAFFKQK